MINKKSKIFVAGHNGMVGSAVLKKLKSKGYSKIIIRDKKSLDLLSQGKVFRFLKKKKGKRGGVVVVVRIKACSANTRSCRKTRFSSSGTT